MKKNALALSLKFTIKEIAILLRICPWNVLQIKYLLEAYVTLKIQTLLVLRIHIAAQMVPNAYVMTVTNIFKLNVLKFALKIAIELLSVFAAVVTVI